MLIKPSEAATSPGRLGKINPVPLILSKITRAIPGKIKRVAVMVNGLTPL